MTLNQGRGGAWAVRSQVCGVTSLSLFSSSHPRVRAAYEGEAATKLLMAASLAWDVLMGAKALRKVWWGC